MGPTRDQIKEWYVSAGDYNFLKICWKLKDGFEQTYEGLQLWQKDQIMNLIKYDPRHVVENVS